MQTREIKVIKIGRITIRKSHNDYSDPRTENDYYVVDWRDGHYEIDDVLQEYKEAIQSIEEFKDMIK